MDRKNQVKINRINVCSAQKRFEFEFFPNILEKRHLWFKLKKKSLRIFIFKFVFGLTIKSLFGKSHPEKDCAGLF